MRVLKMKKYILLIFTAYAVISAYAASLFYIETLAYTAPRCERCDLSAVTGKAPELLTAEDYAFIYGQTGLGEAAVRSLEDLGQLFDYQESYFTAADYRCTPNSPISSEERLRSGRVLLAPLEEGDVLVTNASHVLSWRNGHAAIVTDAERGVTLEAVVIGKNTKPQNLAKWAEYPNFAVLRLKGADKEQRAAIARTAEENLNDIPYNALIGLYPAKYRDVSVYGGTQCAHLVWLAYAAHGCDIDANHGLLVTPEDIFRCGLFEIVQTYGLE